MDRENSSRTEDLPSLVLMASHLGGSAFCSFCRLGVLEQALGGIPLDFGVVVEDKPSELSCTTCNELSNFGDADMSYR